MDAEAALAELLELSSQVEAAVIVAVNGTVEAATTDASRAERLARAGLDLYEAASRVRSDGAEPSRVEVALAGASVVVVREAGRTIVATTVPDPTTGLVVYDLRTALRRLESGSGADA